MVELKEKELKNINGGWTVWATIGVIAAAIFGIGVVDGYVRPLNCH